MCTLERQTPEDQIDRAVQLSKFQYKILSKALSDFANSARYVVYSTCSIYAEENENVIRDILKQKKEHQKLWRAVDLS